MKSILLIVFTFACSSMYSQSASRVTKNHSIKFPMGIAYAYEQPAGKKTVLNFQVDIGGAFTSNGSETSWYIGPVFKFEPRYYYNFYRRQEKGKSVVNNSASYIAISGRYQSGIGFGSGIDIEPALILIPTWGFKAPMGDHFSFNATLGYGLIKFKNQDLQGTPDLYLNFEYNF